MFTLKYKFVLFINLLSIIKVSLLETVHFTNSPNKILKANNFTTYKVDVPNGKPITIIEANTPLINSKFQMIDVDDSKYSIEQNHDSVVNLKSSLGMTVTPDSYNNPIDYEESVTNFNQQNDYNLSPEHQQQEQTMKTVYSPELLQKFLKDYADKVSAHSDELNNNSKDKTGDAIKFSHETYTHPTIEHDDDNNRRVSNLEDNDEDITGRKNYQIRPSGPNSPHPYNKNNGWVTLDAIPWSKSKVSKWQSSVTKYNQNNNNNNNNNFNRPPTRPLNNGGHYINDEDDYPNSNNYNSNNNNNNDDEYYNNRPSNNFNRPSPSYQNNNYHHGHNHYESSIHPTPPSDPWYNNHHGSTQHGSSYNNNYNNNNNNYDNYDRPHHNSNNNRPYQPDIITDNRPANFPNNFPSHNSDSSYSNGNYNGGHSRPRPPNNDYHYGSSSNNNNNYYSNKEHPMTYPNNGNDGEWVLVSTTKGYQFPKRNGQRAMSFSVQNGVNGGNNNIKNVNGIITAAASQQIESTIDIRPPAVAPTQISQQNGVKLNILPLFVNKDSNPYNNNNNNQMEMNVYQQEPSGYYNNSPYAGMLETDPSSQTIEESVAAAANANESNSIKNSATKKKRKQNKNYSVMRKNFGSDSTAVLAAVGAGLVRY